MHHVTRYLPPQPFWKNLLSFSFKTHHENPDSTLEYIQYSFRSCHCSTHDIFTLQQILQRL